MNILLVKNCNALRRLIPVGQQSNKNWPAVAASTHQRRYKHDQQQQSAQLSETINRDDSTPTTLEIAGSSINSRKECLEQLRALSERFYVDLRQVRARASDYEERQIELRSRTHEPSMLVQRRYAQSPLTASILAYVAANDLSAFSVKEKAVMFKMLAMIHSCRVPNETASYTTVLNKLERDFYEASAADENTVAELPSRFSFIDLINYRDAFFYHRAEHPPFHFFTRSLDKMCGLILKSLEKNSTLELIPSSKQQLQQQQQHDGSEETFAAAAAADAINQKWLLDHVHNEPVSLIGYFLRDTAIRTRDMLSLLFTFLIRNQYRKLNDSRPTTSSQKLHPEAKTNALVTLFAIYFRARIPAVLNNEMREFYQQLFQNTWKRCLDDFHLVRNTYARFYYIQMLINRIKIESDSPVNKKLNNLFFREIMSANDPRLLTLSVRCLFELRYRQQEYKRDQKNLPISTYFVQFPIYSKLAQGFADDKCTHINLREKQHKQEKDVSTLESTSMMTMEKENFLTPSDQSIIMQRVEHVIEDPVQLYDFVVLNRNDFFKSLGRPNAQAFMHKFNSMTEAWMRSVRRSKSSGELNEDTLAKLSFGASIRLRSSMRDFALSNRILKYFDKYFLNSNKEFPNRSKSQFLSLILAHREFVNERHMQEIVKLVNENVSDASPIVRQLANDADFFLNTKHARATEDIFLQVYDNTSRRLTEYKWQPVDSNIHDERFSEEIQIATEIINQLFKIRSKIRFNSIGLSLSELLTNMSTSIAWLEENSSRASLKEREAIITGYGRCMQNVAHMALLSNVYNKELIADLLTGSVRLLAAVEAHLPEFERIASVKDVVVSLLTVCGVFDFFDFKSLQRGSGSGESAKSRWSLVLQDLARVRKFNETMYERTRLGHDAHAARSLLGLVHYNFSLLNLDIQFNNAINDMFSNIESVEHFIAKFAYLNDERVELMTKFVYAMNQSLCIKHREKNLIWHFDGYNPLLPFSKSFQNIRQVLETLVDNKNIIQHPMYEYGLVADFEIKFNDENSSHNSNASSHRVPIMIFDKSYYYENLNELKRPIATYVRNFRQLYPLVILNSDIMSKMQLEEKTKYVRRNIMKILNNSSF